MTYCQIVFHLSCLEMVFLKFSSQKKEKRFPGDKWIWSVTSIVFCFVFVLAAL